MKDLRPIRNEQDYEWALDEVAPYFASQPVPGSEEADRFDILSTLIEAYEDARYPISPAADPVDAIVAHMEMAGLSQDALAKLLGSRPRASEVLNRKRALTRDMVLRLNREWHIPAEILITSYALAK